MNTLITQSGSLPVGLVVNGVLHRDYVLRPVTVGDQVEATLEVGEGEQVRLGTAVYARQLLQLGTIPKEEITTELLLTLNPLDWNAIDTSAGELQKKLLRDGPLYAGGTSVAQPSAASA